LIALRSLRRNRLQTLLTVVGMTIGVATVLAMVAVGSGARRSIANQVKAAGMNIIIVTSGNYRAAQQWTNIGEPEGPVAFHPNGRFVPQVRDGVFRSEVRVQLRMVQDGLPEGGGGNQAPTTANPTITNKERPENLGGLGAATTLSMGDAEQIRGMAGVQLVSGSVHETMRVTTGRVLAGQAVWIPQVKGEQAAIADIRRAWVFPHGRFFTVAEEAAKAQVAVLGSVAAKGLFGDRNPVGETITLKGESYKVIGVVASGSWMVASTEGDGQFDAVYIPVGAAQRLMEKSYLDNITVSTLSTGDVARLAKEIGAELRVLHRLGNKTPDDFTVMSQAHTAMNKGGLRTDISKDMMSNTGILDQVTLAQLSKTLESAGRTMSALLASIAAVSLIVGGIGIMNIMLLSVTERTREIGIRRAVGAKSNDVMRQFLMEAVILSLGGGVLGIALGAGASAMIAHVVRWSTELSWGAVALSFTISAAVGILFGYYPAQQASKVTPMTALRYE
jgi:ABC-type antimicrobial peptide transport system permease subunit